MPPSLLASQLAALEPLDHDERGSTIDTANALEVVVPEAEALVARLSRR